MSQVKTESRGLVFVAGLFLTVLFSLAAWSAMGAAQPPAAARVTVFEGARLIVGNGGAPIENAAFIVDNNRFTRVGRRGEVTVPPGAVRVDLTGKTVMPAIVDAHTHLANTREALIDQLEHKAYYGVAAAISLGQDAGNLAFQVREEIVPNAARLRTAGRGLTSPEPGRSDIPYWVTGEAEARKAGDKSTELLPDLIHHKLGLFEIDHLALRIHGGSFALRGVLTGFLQISVEIIFLFRLELFPPQHLFEHPVDDEVRITPDRGGKMGVAS